MDRRPTTREQHSVGDLIRIHKESIVRAWESAVRQLPEAVSLPTPVLRDEMPEIVDRIATLVDANGKVVNRPTSALPEQHALQRLGIGFELAHVLMEYSVLRNCILEATVGERQLSYPEHLALNQAIDAVANRSVEKFTAASERLLKALDQISAEALQSKSLDELLHRLLNVLMKASPAVDSVAILLREDNRLRVRAAQGLIAERDPSFTLAMGEGFSGTIAATREPRLSRSACNDSLVKSEFIKLRKIQALYGVPLLDVDLIGVAHMGSLTVHDFTHEEKLLFQAMANRATIAIVHTQLLERIEAEHNLFVSTVRQMPFGVIIRDRELRLIAANEAAERMFKGAIAERQLVDRPVGLVSVTHADGREIEPRDWPMHRALTGEAAREELTLRWSDGTVRTFDISATPVRGQDGRSMAGVLVFEDITELKQAEAERELYISTLSHDLRNPLAVITMAAATLQGTLADRNAASVERIARNADWMQRLIQQLLDFARSRHAGGIPIDRKPTDLAALCRQLIDSFQASDPTRSIRLEAPAQVVGDCDPDRLAQMLQNLIRNALEHGRQNAPVTVAITVDGANALVRVANETEKAIPSELLPRLFDPFRRGSERGGLGLGLYICQQIARAHGSRVEVTSNDKCTAFTVRLPLAKSPTDWNR